MKMRDVRSVLGLDEGYASITEAGDSVLCTGGFWRFDGDVRRPEGLIVSDGVVRSPLRLVAKAASSLVGASRSNSPRPVRL